MEVAEAEHVFMFYHVQGVGLPAFTCLWLQQGLFYYAPDEGF